MSHDEVLGYVPLWIHHPCSNENTTRPIRKRSHDLATLVIFSTTTTVIDTQSPGSLHSLLPEQVCCRVELYTKSHHMCEGWSIRRCVQKVIHCLSIHTHRLTHMLHNRTSLLVCTTTHKDGMKIRVRRRLTTSNTVLHSCLAARVVLVTESY